ncbi:VPLPA-CTERM sorting domain-containing protein [Jannaschia sp. CCS1]|uniref:VPLPA-CTERM sorting domain-containing protein n=1 Tax=Jannaschia sp. (strain CCS1) TaxID=290400 RepID=UPI000053A2F3|nr:VPLPA-CTERM sorting domain-containing protein [Jannaschia sp. CCS1]ABD54641.1 hypothetical protein Jann_1724 [Jannaschia sp. CCS1]
MLRSAILALSICVALPASAATVAQFNSSVGVTVQTSAANTITESHGYQPGPSSIVTSGDFGLVTGDDNGTDTCCTGSLINTTNPVDLGEAALSATGSVNSVGSVFAEGERRALWSFSNVGPVTQSLILTFDIETAISQAIDPLVGGAAASGTEVRIERDGVVIYNEGLDAVIEELALGTANSELFVYNFDLPSTGRTSTTFNVFVSGYVGVSSDPSEVMSPVPLPAGAVLLVAGLGALGALRRVTSRG